MNVLVVFDPATVPTRAINDFLYWYDMTTEWAQDRDYDSTAGTVGHVAQWWEQMSAQFPPLVDGADNTTRYIIGDDFVYARFGRNHKEAIAAGKVLASDLGLGAYVTGSGYATLPGGTRLE